jgi:hypothetical protein
MPQFAPDQVDFGDVIGYGAWDTGHGREHLQFVQVSSQANPPVALPAYDLFTLLTIKEVRRDALLAHYQTHLLLRGALGITGVDLSAFNLDDPNSFYDFMAYNRDDHTMIRQQLGIT